MCFRLPFSVDGDELAWSATAFCLFLRSQASLDQRTIKLLELAKVDLVAALDFGVRGGEVGLQRAVFARGQMVQVGRQKKAVRRRTAVDDLLQLGARHGGEFCRLAQGVKGDRGLLPSLGSETSRATMKKVAANRISQRGKGEGLSTVVVKDYLKRLLSHQPRPMTAAKACALHTENRGDR